MKPRNFARSQTGAGTGRLEYLNGLRGLAALVVVFHHFFYAFLVYAAKGTGPQHFGFEKYIYLTPLQLLIAGNFAVCIFFILSGYVLSNAFFRSGDKKVVWSGAFKRYFRLMPPILGSVLLSWAILSLGLGYNHQAAAISGAPWLSNFWPQAVTLGEAIKYGTWDIILGNGWAGMLNNALWTMKIEFFGSMLVFGFLAAFGKTGLRWVVYAVLAILTWKSYYLAFVLGIMLCDIGAREWSPARLRGPVVGALVLGGLWLGSAPIPGPTSTVFSWLSLPGADRNVMFALTHIAGAFMLLVALLYSPLLKRVFASRALAYLGKISFSMYLLHLLVLGSFGSYLFTVMNISHGYGTSLVVTGAAYLVIVLIAADIFTRYVDAPSMRLATMLARAVVSLWRRRARPEPAKEPVMINAARSNATNL